MKYTPFFIACLLVSHVLLADAPPKGWETHSPRDEIRPEFGYQVKGGGVFVISTIGFSPSGARAIWTACGAVRWSD
ncbi:MAG: hypothetical protein ACKVKM_13165 [Verrucomicrobiia bacterium]